MVLRDRYSRASLVLQSFPTPITFSRAVTRDVSKRFYYSERHSVSWVVWGIFRSVVLKYVLRFAASAHSFAPAAKSKCSFGASATSWRNEVCRWHVAFACEKHIRLVWRSRTQSVRSAALHPATALRLYCSRENACLSAAARPLSARTFYIELFQALPLYRPCLRHGLELPISNRSAASVGNLGEKRRRWSVFSVTRLQRQRKNKK